MAGLDWSNPFSKGNIGNSLVGMAGTAGSVIGNAISGGYSSGAGNVISGLGSIASAIPGPYGAIASGALSVIGGGVNALFGTKVDQEALRRATEGTNYLNSFQSNATSFDDIQGPMAQAAVSNVYSGGLFSGGSARRKNAELRRRREQAASYANRSVTNNIENLIDDQMSSLQQGFFADGGGIYIKPSKRGTFTAAAKQRGMGVQEFASKVLANKEDYSPAMVKKANFARNASKWHAFGGDLLTNGAAWDNGITFVGNGGTHEANPYEGVQMGIAPDGAPNLVEEGEVVWNDYVFSKRLKVPKKFKEQYKLKGDDISFADAANKFSEESKERPNDPISKNGRDALLTSLMDQQEEVRMKKQARQAKSQFNALSPEEQMGIMQMAQQSAMQGGPEGDMNNNAIEEYPNISAYGGNINHKYAYGDWMNRNPYVDTFFTDPDYIGQYLSPTVTKKALESDASKKQAPIKTNRMTKRYGRDWFERQANSLRFDLGDDFKFDPIDYESNLINFNNRYREIQRQRAYDTYLKDQRQNWINQELASERYRRASGDDNRIYKANIYSTSPGDYIGKDNSWLSTEEFNKRQADYEALKAKDAKTLTDADKATMKAWEDAAYKAANFQRKAGDLQRDYYGNVIYGNEDVSDSWVPGDDILGKDFKWDSKDALKISYDPNDTRSWQSNLRYAPALGGAIGVFTDVLGLTNTPDYSNAAAIEAAASRAAAPQIGYTPIGDYLTYNPLDRNYYLNQLRSSAAASRRAIANQSAGNRGAAMAGILASDYNTIGSIGKLAREAEEYNLAQRQKVADFNRGTNQFNAQMQMQADRANQAAFMDTDRLKLSAATTGAQMRQAEDARVAAARSANLTNFLNSLGQIGEEAYDNDRLQALINRGVLEDLYKARNTTKATGGMLTKKKKNRR